MQLHSILVDSIVILRPILILEYFALNFMDLHCIHYNHFLLYNFIFSILINNKMEGEV
jgi:hypothetical protein